MRKISRRLSRRRKQLLYPDSPADMAIAPHYLGRAPHYLGRLVRSLDALMFVECLSANVPPIEWKRWKNRIGLDLQRQDKRSTTNAEGVQLLR